MGSGGMGTAVADLGRPRWLLRTLRPPLVVVGAEDDTTDGGAGGRGATVEAAAASMSMVVALREIGSSGSSRTSVKNADLSPPQGGAGL